MISCPNCKAEVNDQAHFCKYCGHRLAEPCSSQVALSQQEDGSKKEEHTEEAKGQRILFKVFTFRIGEQGDCVGYGGLGRRNVFYTKTPEEAAKLYRGKAKSAEWHETRQLSEPEPQWLFLDYESVAGNDCEHITIVRLWR